MSRRNLLLVNSVVRLAYGLGGLLSPGAMARGRLVAATDAHPEARLFVRGFSAHQILVAALGLAATQRRGLEAPAIVAAIAVDASDIASALAEGVERGRLDQDLSGGIAFSGAGLATAAWAAAAG
jgi:hypothetical protein